MIISNQDLRSFNTFGIAATARFYAKFTSEDELREVLEARPREAEIMLLGGGSNVLFVHDYNGLLLHNSIPGRTVVKENDDHVWVRFGSGEVWHDVVMHCIQNDWGGIENLSLIPGRIGAAPMQNIGAYGVELKEVFDSLEAVDLDSGEVVSFSNSDCEFGYRESVFKRALKGQYAITSVTLRLDKKHNLKTTYGAIQNELERMGISELNIASISQAVINIRRSKLPDPAEIGNAGSFFKNPIVDQEVVDRVLMEFPDAPNYPAGDGQRKLAAGWLIEKAGWKGFREGDHGVHARQALVLVNYGTATGQQIFDLSSKVLEDVERKFGVKLEREVNII